MLCLGTFQKYLAYISYVGTAFRGIQKQNPSFVNGKLFTATTVQEELENAIKSRFKPLHDVQVYTSSRTDAGVHALRSTVQFELQRERDLAPDKITSELNKCFVSNDTSIRVQSIQKVPSWFSCRFHAKHRTYLYRMGIIKERKDTKFKYVDNVPFSEHLKTYLVMSPDVDIQKMKNAAKLLVGTNDFLSFIGRPSKLQFDKSTIRSLYSIEISPSQPFITIDPYSELFDYWDIVFTGQSFLYKQVRRLVAVMVAVGRNIMTLEEVEEMLKKPSATSWNPRAVCAPPWGLYLVDVSYNPLDISQEFVSYQDVKDENLQATYALY